MNAWKIVCLKMWISDWSSKLYKQLKQFGIQTYDHCDAGAVLYQLSHIGSGIIVSTTLVSQAWIFFRLQFPKCYKLCL